jgi:hypothetical protein
MDAKVKCRIVIDYLDNDENVVDRQTHILTVDYLKAEEINVNVQNAFVGYAVVEVYFDDILMYKNSVDISLDSLI